MSFRQLTFRMKIAEDTWNDESRLRVTVRSIAPIDYAMESKVGVTPSATPVNTSDCPKFSREGRTRHTSATTIPGSMIPAFKVIRQRPFCFPGNPTEHHEAKEWAAVIPTPCQSADTSQRGGLRRRQWR